MIAKILLSIAARKVAKRIRQSATAAVAAGGVAVGGAAAIKPELLELIPEEYRGYVILAYGVLLLVARVRKELGEAVAEAKAHVEFEAKLK